MKGRGGGGGAAREDCFACQWQQCRKCREKTRKKMRLGRLKKHSGLLTVLGQLKPNETSAILPHLSNDAADMVCECVFNGVCQGRTLLGGDKARVLKKLLHKDAKNLKKLIVKRSNIMRKKKVLGQSGGSITLLLSMLAPVIASLVGSVFKK